MKTLRCNSPASTKYWRASFRAVSTASEPPDTRYTPPMPAGARATSRSASASATSVVKKPVWA